eukprot:919711-Prymnesium_polylepis.1
MADGWTASTSSTCTRRTPRVASSRKSNRPLAESDRKADAVMMSIARRRSSATLRSGERARGR